MKDAQARADIEALRIEFDAFRIHTLDAINTHYRCRLDLERRVNDLQTTVNLLLGFVNGETYIEPEVPAVAAIPAHLAIRKVPKPK